jgi:hypothetical protein
LRISSGDFRVIDAAPTAGLTVRRPPRQANGRPEANSRLFGTMARGRPEALINTLIKITLFNNVLGLAWTWR